MPKASIIIQTVNGPITNPTAAQIAAAVAQRPARRKYLFDQNDLREILRNVAAQYAEHIHALFALYDVCYAVQIDPDEIAPDITEDCIETR